ncbi:DNA gyrase inhibitor YacG [Asticcacaulis sp. MM231]|uniref:DNA gyrase inhibitor YacG n=1 Tax=Asticcacaulis sp. MM231 TaxID=3157666 RepID=UPI0032D597C4
MIRKCTRCQKPYGEAIEGVVSVAPSYAPFCSKRCADVDLVHWLKGDYVIDGAGGLTVSEEDEGAAPTSPHLPYDDGDE